ncbi:MAG TPA: hypothetical protein VNY52_00490 [Solirubrobacteraceae bacterium]|jgi:hypothetical protein|nr:hypothetical protein [Solirubrobacteraceae bacterium]
MQQLSELIGSARRLALVGLAKNTGKTETLAAALRELRERGRRVGVTSVGRDGEERDVIDIRIEKPRVELWAGALVATTDALLRAGAIPHEIVQETGVRTPLGRVLIARLHAQGTIEVAGPSAAADVREVCDAMLAHGAEQVLIDGAIDRRAASSPAVSDGLVMSTGAALHEEIELLVARTRDAVDLVRLPELGDERVRAIAASNPASVLLGEPDEEPVALHPRFVLTSTAADIAQLLRARPSATRLIVRGALCEPFLAELLRACKDGSPVGGLRSLELVVADPTRVFLTDHGVDWYHRQGLSIAVLAGIDLRAITVNPVAPHSHSFDSARLRAMIEEVIPDVPVLDVRDPTYNLVPAA